MRIIKILSVGLLLIFISGQAGICGTYLYEDEKGRIVTFLPKPKKDTQSPNQKDEKEKDRPPAGQPYVFEDKKPIQYDPKK